MKGPRPKEPMVRFAALYIPEPNSGCWLWIGALDSNGYAKFYDGKESVKASRFSWSTHRGSTIPEGLHVLHRCDNPACVNPDHLFLGTNLDNIRDCWAKGRRKTVAGNLSGEAHGCAKLTTEQVAKIRDDNRRHREIAADFALSRSQISKIKKGEAWRHEC